MAASAVMERGVTEAKTDVLALAARYGGRFRRRPRPIHPTARVEELRERFCRPFSECGASGEEVIDELIAAAEPGLVGNTDPNFFAWVMGSSDPVGVAADWLTAVWGQNAAIYQTSPAAAVAEEAVAAWLLDLLDLPRESSVGFVSGATMATFVGLAAARSEVLRRAGHDFERHGLQGAPFVSIFASDDIHVSDLTAIRHLGFGDANIRLLASDDAGLVSPETLATAMASVSGPKIVIAQAGHINSGGFERFRDFARLARAQGAWLHVDGAFGLWARVLSDRRHLTDGIEDADSWAVDGHKWLQLPYDSGFAIVRHKAAHLRAMETSAAYLSVSDGDGRNPASYGPGLSRRARGFAAWAVLRSLGRDGVRTLVGGHCDAAARLAVRINGIDGLRFVNRVDLNQVVVATAAEDDSDRIDALADRLNAGGHVFVRPARWKGRPVLRLSVIAGGTTLDHIDALAEAIETAWNEVSSGVSRA